MIAAARKHGKFPGMAGVYNETIMPRYIELGARCVRAAGCRFHGGRGGPANRVLATARAPRLRPISRGQAQGLPWPLAFGPALSE